MIWEKLTFLRSIFASREQAAAVSRRWYWATRETPELAQDVIRLGGVLVAQAAGPDGLEPLDPLRLAYEAGKRDLALSLLAMMQLKIGELNAMMEANDED